eukprot:CAMPEP_0204511600 /NCGR_PEP_ID=MMETSP0661-20131031/519_1 /ASSEMBLY_ACC=CAM_ASM_000606 /TAXON_ID=109239 /ORGANISM="Alexandrium margalefi, Strain AMGDE01CS-322" /LENGTH=31 /DNA_ID= /DNA_START= /DNA_END= /DNA_ORIENTATION=
MAQLGGARAGAPPSRSSLLERPRTPTGVMRR